jgi:SAM-dependent methyltransferase
MAQTVQQHEVEWTPEQVKRFWDFYSTNPGAEDSYFAKMVGPALLKLVRKHIKIGTALDLGCGPGELMAFLVAAGHDTYGVDSSPASIEKVARRFENVPHFRGAARVDGTIDLADAIADTAFMIEVVEHMNDEALAAALSEARRVLRPGGHIVITTPNEENLDASRTMCPECGGTFHRVQHVRSWSSRTLSACLERHGFLTVISAGTVLSTYKPPLAWLYRAAYPILRGRKPHLVYIGKKAAAG